MPASGTAYSFNTPGTAVAGYYAVFLDASLPSTYTVNSLTWTKPSGVTCCHRSINGFENNSGSADALRIIAFSARYMQRAAALQAEGTVAAAQLPQGENWFNYMNTDGSGYTKVAGIQGGTEMPILKGFYGWARCTQAADVGWISDWEALNGALRDSYYQLEPTSASLVVYPRVTVGVAQDGVWVLAASVEFQTTDQWKEVDEADSTLVSFEEAIVSSKGVGQWHENPLHWAELFKQVGTAIKTYGPGVLGMAGKVISML